MIPTYNRCDSLFVTLRALEQQTIDQDQFEVIVVSDGSTDHTHEELNRATFPFRLRLVIQENSGPSVARNRGSRLATAPILLFIDDDIQPTNKLLETHLQAHEQTPKLVAIGPQNMPPNEHFPVWVAWEHRMLEKQYVKFQSGEWKAGPNNLYSGNFSVNTSDLLAVNGFDETFIRQEDVELGYRLAAYGCSFQFLNDAIAWHRPTRSWSSWLNTPFMYGKRDIQMARNKGESQAMRLAQKHFRERSRMTQMIARVVIGVPLVEALALSILKALIPAFDRVGGRKVSLGLCSLLFNLLYLQGMSLELGGRSALWREMSPAKGG